MNPLNLLWIIPLSASFGAMIEACSKIAFYNADGKEQSCEPEGGHSADDGHFYVATTKGVLEFYM